MKEWLNFDDAFIRISTIVYVRRYETYIQLQAANSIHQENYLPGAELDAAYKNILKKLDIVK